MILNDHYSDMLGESTHEMLHHDGRGVESRDWEKLATPLAPTELTLKIIGRQMVKSKARFISVFGSTVFSTACAMFSLSLTGASSRFEGALIIAAVSCLIVGVVAISQSLKVAATESRMDDQMLLAAGFPESRVRWLTSIEAMLASLPGAVMGVVGGWLLTLVMVPFIISQNIKGFVTLEATFRPWAVVLVLFGGVVTALIASLGPSREAMKTDWSNVDSLRLDTKEAKRSAKAAWALGVVSFMAGVVLMIWSSMDDVQPSWTVVIIECLLFVIGLYVSYPLLFGFATKGIRWIVERVLRCRKTSVLVALRSLDLRRSSASAVSASVTVGLIFLAVVTMIGSWESTQDQIEMANDYHGTSQVRLRKSTGLKKFQQTDLEAWSKLDGVVDVLTFSAHQAKVPNRNGSPITITYYSVDGNPFEHLVSGEGTEEAKEAWTADGGGAVVGCTLAETMDIKVGNTYNIGPPGKTRQVRIAAETCDGWLDTGLLVSSDLLDPSVHDITSAYIVHDPDSGVSSTKFNRKMAEDYPRYVFIDRGQLIKSSGASALWELLVYYGAGALVITVAVAGLFTMMALAVMQRKREFGLLSAYGMDPASIRASIWIEAGVIGLIAGVLGAGIGSVLGLVVGSRMGMMEIDSSVWLLEGWLVIATVIVSVFAAFIPSFVAVRAGASTIRDE